MRTDVLARVAMLSLGHFNRAFLQSTGFSPHQYILRQRVALATELMQTTSRALADIALEVGFGDQSHFSRTYAAITGETPSACRRRHRQIRFGMAESDKPRTKPEIRDAWRAR